MQHTISSKQSTLVAWAVCLCAGLFFAYELMQFHMLNAISPMLMKDLHLSGSAFGLLGSTYLLADVIFLLPAGILLDRYSPRKIILAALAICVLGTLGFGMSQNFLQACIAHFLSGIGNAFCFLSCIILISRWFALEKQSFVIGVIVTLGMLGGVIAQAPFSYLAEHVNWRNALFIDGAIGVILFGLIFIFVKDGPKKIAHHETEPFLPALVKCILNKQNIFCGLYTAFTNLPLMVIGAAWGSLFLSQVHGLTLGDASLVAGMICSGTIVGSSLAGYLADYTGQKKRLMFVGAFLSLCVMGAIMILPKASFAQMLFLFFCLGLFSSTQVLGYPLITEKSPAHLTGTSMGVAAVIIMGVAGLAQVLSGKLIDWHWNHTFVDGTPLYQVSDFRNCFMMFPIVLLLSCLILLFIEEKSSKKVLS